MRYRDAFFSFFLSFFAFSCKNGERRETLADTKGNKKGQKEEKHKAVEYPKLTLVLESKLCELLPKKNGKASYCDDSLEASGVDFDANGSNFYVVLDNSYTLLKVPFVAGRRFGAASFFAWEVDLEGKNGFEGLHIEGNQFFVNVEVKNLLIGDKEILAGAVASGGLGSDVLKSFTEESLVSLIPQKHNNPMRFKDDNKGYEGLAYAKRSGIEYLFALCEGNECKKKEEGDAFAGRIHIYTKKQGENEWEYLEKIKLDGVVDFHDYSGLDIVWTESGLGDILIVSQEDQRLWKGEIVFDDDSFELKGKGQVYSFPKNEGYCNIEGVAWFGEASSRQIVVVSDQAKKEQKKDKSMNCEDKDQSIHLFNIP